MADWSANGLYDTLGVPLLDGDRFEVLGSPAGPAGSSAIELPDGSLWEVDHFNPGIPVRLEVDALDPAGSPLLITAFGGDGALSLTDQALEGFPEQEVGDALVAQRPGSWDHYLAGARSRPGDPGVEAGRLIVLTDLSGDPRTHPLARVAASAELVLTADQVAGGELLRPLLPAVVDRAEELAEDIDDEDLEHLPPTVASRLASTCMRAAKISQRSDSPLMGLGRRADGAIRGHPDLRTTRYLAASRGLDHDAVASFELADAVFDEDVAEFSSTELDAADRFLEVRRITPTLLRVAVGRRDHPRWVRVLRRQGLVLLAQAPLRREGLLEAAELIVPPDVTDDDLHVEVRDLADLDALVGRPIERIRAAVHAGREAARSTRLRNGSFAAFQWQRCAELWDRVGDDDRALLARTFATPTSLSPQVLPYLADEVAESLPDPF